MMNQLHSSVRSFWTSCAALFLLMLPMGCRSAPPSADLGTYYTQCTVQLHRNLVTSTNYRSSDKAETLTINTEVELIGIRKHRFTLRGPDGQDFRYDHIRKHSKDTPGDSFAKIFARTPVDVGAFNESEQEAISKGEAAVGMSREAVLAAIGPPPSHVTPSLESNEWKYWNTRWNSTFFVRFGDDGKVTSVGQ